MKRIFFIGILIIICSTVKAQVKDYEVNGVTLLEAGNAFVWKGDTIRKDSLVYVELKPDSIRLKKINGSWTKWYHSGNFIKGKYKQITDSVNLTGYTSRKRLASEMAKKEDKANKENVTMDNSATKYPTNNLVKTYVDGKVTTINSTYASELNYGIIKLADWLDMLIGEDDLKAVTPMKLKDYVKTNVVPYNGANQDIDIGTFNIKADTVQVTNIQVNGSSVIPGNYELLANKSTNVTTDGASDTKYPSVKSVKTYVDGKVADVITDGVTAVAPSQNAVNDALALKAPVNNPVFTGTVETPSLRISSFTNDGYDVRTLADGTLYASPHTASLVPKGTWDASTNTPTLVNGTGTAGWYYRVTVGGTVNFGAGNITFNNGDDVIYNGSTWYRQPAATIVGNELSVTNDQNIHLNLTGAYQTALLNPAEITVQWTGTLADNRIASAANWNDVYNRTTGTNTGDTQTIEIEVTSAGVTTYALPFTLKSNANVWLSGSLLRNSQWSGTGSTSITLYINTMVNDIIKIQN